MPNSSSVAFEVQKRLLSEPPNIEGVDLAVAWTPHGEVGGDFYDFLVLEEDSFAITLGDVSGKGFDAALLMVLALAELRAGLKNRLRLPFLMSQLDESLRRYSSSNRFAEVVMGLYSLTTRRFTFVQGGGIFPIVFHQSTERLFLNSKPNYRVPGLAIEAGKRQRYVENSVDLEAGDFMMLMSDGISEREDEEGEEIVRRDSFGALIAPPLKSLCQEHRGGSAADLLGAISRFLDELKTERRDDETLIVLKAV